MLRFKLVLISEEVALVSINGNPYSLWISNRVKLDSRICLTCVMTSLVSESVFRRKRVLSLGNRTITSDMAIETHVVLYEPRCACSVTSLDFCSRFLIHSPCISSDRRVNPISLPYFAGLLIISLAMFSSIFQFFPHECFYCGNGICICNLVFHFMNIDGLFFLFIFHSNTTLYCRPYFD